MKTQRKQPDQNLAASGFTQHLQQADAVRVLFGLVAANVACSPPRTTGMPAAYASSSIPSRCTSIFPLTAGRDSRRFSERNTSTRRTQMGDVFPVERDSARFPRMLAASGARVTGIDFCEAGLDACRVEVPSADFRFGDLTQPPESGTAKPGNAA